MGKWRDISSGEALNSQTDIMCDAINCRYCGIAVRGFMSMQFSGVVAPGQCEYWYLTFLKAYFCSNIANSLCSMHLLSTMLPLLKDLYMLMVYTKCNFKFV